MERLTDRKTKLAKGGPEPSMLDVVHKLAEYETLDEQGKLLKLPCALGDTVYEIDKISNTVPEFEVKCFHISQYGIYIEGIWFNGFYKRLSGFNDSEIGKTVFLTREEAEAALQGNES